MAKIDKIGVASGVRDEQDRHTLEPEEQPAAQIGTAPVSWHGSVPDFEGVNGGVPIIQQDLKEDRQPLQRHVEAGRLAIEQAVDCGFCRHFDHARFYDKNPEREQAVATLALAIGPAGAKIALTTEAAETMARSAGLCHQHSMARVIPGLNGCMQFKAVDNEAARLMAGKRDAILHAAEGRHEGRIIITGRGESA